jgi:hypothetical protein
MIRPSWVTLGCHSLVSWKLRQEMSLPSARHVEQGVIGANPAAAEITSAAFTDEGDPAVGEPDGIEIVPGAIRQAFEARAIDVDLEDVVTPTGRPVAPRRVGVIS